MTTQEILNHADDLNSKVIFARSRIELLEKSGDMSASAPVKLDKALDEHREAMFRHTSFMMLTWDSDKEVRACSNP